MAVTTSLGGLSPVTSPSVNASSLNVWLGSTMTDETSTSTTLQIGTETKPFGGRLRSPGPDWRNRKSWLRREAGRPFTQTRTIPA